MSRFIATEARTSAQLLDAARNGDPKAARELYDRHAPVVFRVAHRLLDNRADAEDITQEVFVRIYRQMDAFDFRSSLQTWCYRITVNACYDVMRKRKRRARYHGGSLPDDAVDGRQPLRTDTPEVSRQLLIGDVHAHVRDALAMLHPDLRTALVLKDVADLSYKDIARVMGCSTGTVASRLARARKQTARYLRRVGIDESYLQ